MINRDVINLLLIEKYEEGGEILYGGSYDKWRDTFCEIDINIGSVTVFF